jgi:hypothetical protein
MAKIYGESGAWQKIGAHLASVQLEAAQPNELAGLLESCSQEHETQLEKARQTIGEEIALLEQEVAQEREKASAAVAEYRQKYALEIEQAEATLDYYRHERQVFNFVRRLFRIRREAGKLEQLNQTVAEDQFEIEKVLREREKLLDERVSGKEALAERLCYRSGEKVEALKSLLNSPVLAQANLEFDLLKSLTRLPENCHVLNALYLHTDRGIRFEDDWLIEGQIDQLVVTPAGLFAIGLHSSGQDNEDPQRQIRRAAHLLHSFVKPQFPGVTARSILAYQGRLPDSQKTGIVKTLNVQDVPEYINWFKDQSLDEAQMERLVTFLQEIQRNKV